MEYTFEKNWCDTFKQCCQPFDYICLIGTNSGLNKICFIAVRVSSYPRWRTCTSSCRWRKIWSRDTKASTSKSMALVQQQQPRQRDQIKINFLPSSSVYQDLFITGFKTSGLNCFPTPRNIRKELNNCEKVFFGFRSDWRNISAKIIIWQ